MQLTDYIRDIPDFPKPGILFRDITPLLATPAALREAIRRMKEEVAAFGKIDKIAAVEARGFLFAIPLSLELDIGMVPIRKPGKLPPEVIHFSYELEYGSDTLEMHADAVKKGERVLLVDDLLATGGTMNACCKMVEMVEAEVAGCAFVIELSDLNGAAQLPEGKKVSLIQY